MGKEFPRERKDFFGEEPQLGDFLQEDFSKMMRFIQITRTNGVFLLFLEDVLLLSLQRKSFRLGASVYSSPSHYSRT